MVLTVFVFLLDTINADVLIAAIAGEIRFEDNPLILDSQFDATRAGDGVHVHTNAFELAKFDGGAKCLHSHATPRFFGTTIIEDVDSPTVLDGASTATLNYSIKPDFRHSEAITETPPTTIDRTISFSCLLI